MKMGKQQKCQVIPWSIQEFHWVSIFDLEWFGFQIYLGGLGVFYPIGLLKGRFETHFLTFIRMFLFIRIYIYIFICIDCSGDSLYANINLPDSQIRMCFPGFKLGPNFCVDLLFWLNGMRLCESPTPQTFTPLLQLKSEDLNFRKKTV